MNKTLKWSLLGIFALAFGLRMLYCWSLPLSGDESVSLLQAAGKAVDYSNHIPAEPTSIKELQRLMEYSPEYGFSDVLESMEKAGMHPPAYYLLLHYTMKYFGNSAILLRTISVFFSALSTILLFLIGRKISGTICGIFAAIFLVVSTYGVHFALMVRPYPFVMFLSLLSSWFLLLYLESSDSRNKKLFYTGFLLTAILAFYTIYLFAFVFLFQIAFLILYKPNKRNSYFAAALACGIILFSYLPWIPHFLDQFRIIRSGSFYFYGKSSILSMLEFLFSYNLSEFLPGRYAWYKFLILSLYIFVAGFGVFGLWKLKFGKPLLFAAIVYVLGYYCADRLLNMHTLNATHFMFFLIPLVFLILGSGIQSWHKKPVIFLTAGIILLLILAVNLSNSFSNPQTHDRLYCTENIRRAINTQYNDSKRLILIYKPTRRILLSTISPVQTDADVIGVPKADYAHTLGTINSTSYKWLFIPIYDKDRDSLLDDKHLKMQKEKLESLGFQEYEITNDRLSQTTLLIYKNQEMNELP